MSAPAFVPTSKTTLPLQLRAGSGSKAARSDAWRDAWRKSKHFECKPDFDWERCCQLFNAAAVTASGGFLERMRARTARLEDPVDRVVETLVILISEIPEDPYLAELFRMREAVSVRAESQNASVANELRLYLGDRWREGEPALEAFAEILLRLLRSFVDDPGPARTTNELRALLARWIEPMLRPCLH